MPRDRLRVVTFNVAMQSAEVIAGALEASPSLRGADVILLQEIEAHADEERSRAGQVAALLGMTYAYAPAFACSHGGSHGVAILSRHPLSGARVTELPRRDVRYNSGALRTGGGDAERAPVRGPHRRRISRARVRAAAGARVGRLDGRSGAFDASFGTAELRRASGRVARVPNERAPERTEEASPPVIGVQARRSVAG